MRFVAALRHLLRQRWFRRLFAVRVTGQFADGFLQIALASFVLFSPERQPDAPAIALALTAVLLPYSVLGPFVGVFLDRWSRRQILVVANLLRALPVTAVAVEVALDRTSADLFVLILLAMSVNRFLLAGLSASLPHVVEPEELVLANSVTPTTGTLAFFAGLGCATLLRAGLPGRSTDALIVLIAVIGYVAAAGLAARMPRDLLGPDRLADSETVPAALHDVVRGLRDGLQHLHERPIAARALAVVAAHRFLYGIWMVLTVLLYRNTFYAPRQSGAALNALGVALAAAGVGFLLAAILTPVATSRLMPQRWIVVLLLGAAVAMVLPGSLFAQPAMVATALVLGLSAQSVKICVDTLVQTGVEDDFRGRVFAVYDVLFNVMFIAAAAVGALIVPADGRSYLVVGLLAAGYAVAAGWYQTRAATQSMSPVSVLPRER